MITIVAVFGLALGAVGSLGCKEKGAMEKAGEAVDEAVDDVTNMGDGPMEKAGEDIDEAARKAKEAVGGTH
jgi:hypothetical protein